jgi:hypothetical protein
MEQGRMVLLWIEDKDSKEEEGECCSLCTGNGEKQGKVSSRER